MHSKVSAWQNKIDPAFSKIIQQYIQFLDTAGLPANTGWVILASEQLGLWQEKDIQGWIKDYEKKKTKEIS